MSPWNGRGTAMNTTIQKQSEEALDNPMNLIGLRLWVLCAMIIVAFGVTNYVLNWVIGGE